MENFQAQGYVFSFTAEPANFLRSDLGQLFPFFFHLIFSIVITFKKAVLFQNVWEMIKTSKEMISASREMGLALHEMTPVLK